MCHYDHTKLHPQERAEVGCALAVPAALLARQAVDRQQATTQRHTASPDSFVQKMGTKLMMASTVLQCQARRTRTTQPKCSTEASRQPHLLQQLHLFVLLILLLRRLAGLLPLLCGLLPLTLVVLLFLGPCLSSALLLLLLLLPLALPLLLRFLQCLQLGLDVLLFDQVRPLPHGLELLAHTLNTNFLHLHVHAQVPIVSPAVHVLKVCRGVLDETFADAAPVATLQGLDCVVGHDTRLAQVLVELEVCRALLEVGAL
mmetsp:Transcript_1741/g.3801  ORF Transcript_1741/g.3801 Transcript_1741/m.3801 type:complete len:258 (-) Transcript_1741:191-964(-)